MKFAIKTCGAALAALSAHWAWAATAPDLIPPGLYRVDIVSTVQHNTLAGTMETQTKVDGATGTDETTYVGLDGARARRSYAGDGRQTTCVPKLGAQPLPAFAKGACVSQPAVPGNGGTVMVARCPSGEYTTTIRRIDDKTWEVEYITKMTGVVGAGEFKGGIASLKAMLGYAAKNASTAREREEASQSLAKMNREMSDAVVEKLDKDVQTVQEAGPRAMAAHMPELRASLEDTIRNSPKASERQGAAQALARLNNPKPPLEMKSIHRMVRIADRCDG
jgi:hypothetical protein